MRALLLPTFSTYSLRRAGHFSEPAALDAAFQDVYRMHLSSRAVDPPFHTIIAFITLQMIGGGGLLIIVATAIFSKRIKRWPTWYSFCISWIISCVSYSLRTLAGQQFQTIAGQRTQVVPNHVLCLIQAASIYAAPPLTTCTTLSLITHIILRLRFAKSDSYIDSGFATKLVLLIVPYCVWTIIVLGFTLFTINNPNTLAVAPTGTFCNSTDPVWARLSFTVVVITSAGIVFIQGYLGLFIYRNSDIRLNNGHLFATATRVIIFSFIGILTLVVALVYAMRPKHEEALDLVLAVFPLLALLTFGTQSDIWEAWAFWRHRPMYSPLRNKI